MLSLVLYGRNDNHGYNLHKRAAISLNAMAEVLTDADDEILFVDYNTPDDLPTFPEAISDTLTERAKEKLRVLRVRPILHEQFKSRTHLNALESISRNIATRRSNPNNRWVLSTNTDMIFVPHDRAESLSDIVRNLPDGFYQLPRMELPEVLWESFDRRDGAGMVERTREWAKRFHLNEIVKGSDDVLYDGPGDFQLCLRSDLFAMHGFHEGMLRGWHVDANLCVRMLKRYGRIESLAQKLFAYHCDHTRQATPSHTHDRLENSADEFVSRVREPGLPAQAEVWGLPEAEIEEVRLGRADVFSRYLKGLEAAIPAAQLEVYESAYRSETFGRLAYRRAHVLPFVMDLVAPFPRHSRILYVGSRMDMFEDFVRAHAAIADDVQIIVPETATWLPENPHARRAPLTLAVREADLLIFEFGVAEEETPMTPEHRERFSAVRRAFRVAVLAEQERAEKGGARRRVVAINAIHNEFEGLVANHVAFTLTPFASRVRQGYFLLEGIAAEHGFDVRTVWRDVGRALGRSRPPPLAEGQELARLAVEAAAAGPNTALSTEALGCAAPLLALLNHTQVEQATGIPRQTARALAQRLEEERPSNRLAHLTSAPRGLNAVAPTRVADNSDWERPAFARFVSNHFGGAAATGFVERNLWTWERAAVLDALAAVDALKPGAKALMISTVPDLLAPALSDYTEDLHIAGVSADPGRPMIAPPAVDDSSLSAFTPWSPDNGACYDIIVVIQHALFAQGPARFAEGLVEVQQLLTDGGHVVVSTGVSLAGWVGPHELPAAHLAGHTARILSEGSGYALCGPVDVTVSAPTLDRTHPHRRTDLKHRELLSVRAGRTISEAVVTLRRTRTNATAEARRRVVERALFGDAFQSYVSRALLRARPTAKRVFASALRRPAIASAVSALERRFDGSVDDADLWGGAPVTWSASLRTHSHVTVENGRFEIAAGAPDGHAIFGPYNPLGAGVWDLTFRARLISAGAAGKLAVDVAQGDVVIAAQMFSAEELDGRELRVRFMTLSNLLFKLTRSVNQLEVQTRFGVLGGAGIEIRDIQVARPGAVTPGVVERRPTENAKESAET